MKGLLWSPYRFVAELRADWRRVAGLVVMLAALFGYALSVNRVARMIERPTDCDPFGYLRQAQLVKERGVLGGLRTAIDDPTTRYVIDKTTELLGPDIEIGPYCHRYKPRTNQVVLQYPPGVGYVFSLFSPGRQVRLALATWIAVLMTTLAWAALSFRFSSAALIFLPLGFYCLHGILWFYTSFSTTPSVAIAVLLGLVTVGYFSATSARARLWLAAAIGLLIGLASDGSRNRFCRAPDARKVRGRHRQWRRLGSLARCLYWRRTG
jgi:hypothetical protein